MAIRREASIVALVVGSLFAALDLSACKDNIFTGSTVPVPPVHRLPADVSGAVILIAEDPTIETRDANHVARANALRVPQDLRAAMTKALRLAGFRVIDDRSQPHDLVAKLAIAVDEDGDRVRQVYRCGLTGAEGTPVAQIDWEWPRGTFVGELEVYDFATHNLATEVATSQRVIAWLRAKRRPSPVDAADAGIKGEASR